jgi:Na+/serine symporter
MVVLVGCGGMAATETPLVLPPRVATPAVVLGSVPLGSMTGAQFVALTSGDRFKAVDTALLNYRCPDAISYTQIAAETAGSASTAANGSRLIVPLIIATAIRDDCAPV